jgi:hypothetical protein
METQLRSPPHREHESVCEAIVLAVADAEGVAPDDLSLSLYDVVDPDALKALFSDDERAARSDLSVTFTYENWNVHVYDGGDVSVIERPDTRADGTDPSSDR